MSPDADLVILDADGVVFSAEFEDFLRSRAARRGEDPGAAVVRWDEHLRDDFWSGRLTPSEMWTTLFPGGNPAQLTADLERRYKPGPLFDLAARGGQRMWLMANDRSGWLLPRLRRFGLSGCFERIIVSDASGVATPDRPAFDVVLEAMRFDRVVVVDDDPAVVDAASRLGIDARLPAGRRTPHGAAKAA